MFLIYKKKRYLSQRNKKNIKKKKTLKKRKQENKTKTMIIKEHEIKGWRNEIRNKNFNKILLKAYNKGIKTIIVKDDDYVDKKYNVHNQIKKRKLI